MMRTSNFLLVSLVVVCTCSPTLASAANNVYTYDKLNRLTSATIDGSRIEYVYDSAGNITSVLTPYSIVVTKTGDGDGTITGDFGKIDCGERCGGVYDVGAAVTLTAFPEPGHNFEGWSGACSGIDDCLLTVTGAMDVGAEFSVLSANLVISKDDGIDSIAPGESTTYEIVVSNLGPAAVDEAAVVDDFADTLDCNWTSLSAGGATGSAGTGTGDLDETLLMPAGSTVTYTAICDIDPDATGTLSNTATVSAAVSDPTPGDESATDTTELAATADLWLDIGADPENAGLSGTITYTVQVGNNGPSTATSLTMTDVLPADSTLGTVTQGDWTCNEVGGALDCTVASLDPNTQSEISFELTLGATAGEVINSAAVSSTTLEASPGDESDSVTVTLYGPPTIDLVGSVAPTADGFLIHGASTDTSITQLLLEASHDMKDVGGDSDPNDVTNAECYRLFIAAGDGTFPAADCSQPSNVPISGVAYGDAGPYTASLAAGGGLALPEGDYRLLACASGVSFLEDAYGQALDGDGDGTPGDDFGIDFSVIGSNLLHNPNLDFDLGGWDVVSQSPGDVLHEPDQDASSMPSSGSARLANLTGAGSVLEISQCMGIGPDTSYLLRGSLRAASSGQDFPAVSAFAIFYGSAGCAGVPLGSVDAGSVSGDSAGLWTLAWDTAVGAPDGAVSALVAFQVTGDEFNAEAWLDELEFLEFDGVIFSDGFESGDTSAWSQ